MFIPSPRMLPKVLPPLLEILGDKVNTVIQNIKSTKCVDFFTVTQMDYNLNGDEFVVISYGNIIGGLPVCVVFRNIFIPIYVKLTNVITEESVIRAIKGFNKYISIKSSKVVYKKTITDYQHQPSAFLEIDFTTSYNRTTAIKCLVETWRNVEICENEKSYLHRNVWARYGIRTSGWLTLKKCSIGDLGIYNGVTISVNMCDVYDLPDNECNDELHKIALRTCAWDIETKTYGPMSKKIEFFRITKDLVNGYDEIKMLSLSFKWLNGDYIKSSSGISLNFVLTTEDSDKSEGIIIVLCKDQFNLIDTFFYLLDFYKPSFLMDFNGFLFDWPMVAARIDKNPSLKDRIINRQKMGGIKPSQYMCAFGRNDTDIKMGSNVTLPGTSWGFLDMVCIDIRPTLKKDFEYGSGDKANIDSLNGFLEDNGLQLKDDMPYEVMWKIMDSGDKAGMAKVIHYALQDSIALHLLQDKRNIIIDIQEIGNITFTNAYTGVFLANGKKIINALRNEILSSDQIMTQSQYVKAKGMDKFGGLVLEPSVGLHAYNIFDIESYSPDLKRECEGKSLKFAKDNIERNREYIRDIQSKRLRNLLRAFYREHPGNIQGEFWIADRPSFAADIKSSYPSSIIAENMSKDMLINNKEEADRIMGLGVNVRKHKFGSETKWIVQHDNDPKKMGCIVRMLHRLFAKRVLVKKEVSIAKSKGDHFLANLLTSKEKGIKLILNTTYGLFLEDSNAYFKSEYLGKGTCNVGRFYLLITKMFLEHMGCIVNYGDTDSNYAQLGNDYFKELDEQYSKRLITIEEYNIEMINLTIKKGMEFGKKIDEQYSKYSIYVKIDYEDTLWRSMFIKHKMYFGRQFMRSYEPLTDIKTDMLQRGVATRNKDKSQYVKTCFYEFMEKCCEFDIKKSVYDIIRKQVAKLDDNKYDMKLFKRVAMYKNVKTCNVKINTFVLRMFNLYNIEIDNLQKFEYYVVIKDNGLDIKGRKITGIGEKMYLCSIVEDPIRGKGLSLDFNYYVKTYIGSVSGVLAYKFGSADRSKKHMESLLKKTDKVEVSEKLKTFKKLKNDKYHALDINANISILRGHDFSKSLVDQVILKVNKKYYNIPMIKIWSGDLTCSKDAQSEYLKSIIRSELLGIKLEYDSYTQMRQACCKKISSSRTSFNDSLLVINNNKKKYISIMDEYNDFITSSGSSPLPSDDLVELRRELKNMVRALKTFVVFSVIVNQEFSD